MMPQVLSAEHSAIIKQTVGIKRCTHHDCKHTAGTNLTNTLLITSMWLVLSAPKRACECGYRVPRAIAYTKSGAGTGNAAHISLGIVCIANTQYSLGTGCQPNPSLAPSYVLCYK